MSRRRSARRRRRVIVATAVCLVALGGAGTAAYALVRPGGPEYRTAVAAIGSVVQQASGVGTIGLVAQQQAAFQVAGTVGSVDVAVGDIVQAGQTLATLDPTDLEESVQTAEEALAEAEDQLATDLEDQASGTSSSSSASAGQGAAVSVGTTARATGGAVVAAASRTGGQGGELVIVNAVNRPSSQGGGAGGGAGGLEQVTAAADAVKAAQDELLAAYDVVSGLLEASAGELEASQAACVDFLAAVFPSPADPDDPDAADGAEAGAQALAAIQQSLKDCQSAIAATQSGQSALGAAQLELMEKAAALNAAVDELAAAVAAAEGGAGGENPGDGTGTGTDPGDGAGADPGDGADAGGSGPGGAGGDQAQDGTGQPGGTASGGGAVQVTITAEQILSDRAQIELLEAELAITVQQRQAAVLTSAITGTVLAVDAAAGDSVTAGQAVAVIDGGQGFTVTLTLPLSTIKELAIGNSAVFTAGSTDQELTGQIASIGVTNLSSTSVPSFAVVLAVDQTDAVLFDGASATVLITVASSDNVVTVPTSAVHVSGTEATVQQVVDSELVDVPVVVGALGAELTEIADGLSPGDEVVLADLSKDVVTESSTTGGSSSLLGGQTTPGRGGGLSVNVVPNMGGGAPMMPGG